jgi:extracellular matrix protein 14
MAMGLAKAFRLTNGHIYGVSSACEAITVASDKNEKIVRPKMELGGGSALDWFYHELGVKYTFQVKLRDTGSYGFLLPKAHIVPTGQETYNAVLALGKYLLGNKGIELDWEKESISVSNVAEENRTEDQEAPFTENGAENPLWESEEDEDEDWSMELRRRRRR